MDKIPVLDSIGHVVMLPVSAAAGAILFASQTGAVSSVHPGLAVLASVLVGGSVAGAVHVVRSGIRPVANGALLGPPISLFEDISAAVLAVAAVLAPVLLPVVIALLVVGVVVLVQRRRRAALSVR
jgi:hypothetical protein